MNGLTTEEALKIVPAQCCRSGSQGGIYPVPLGRGTFWCPICSPPDLKRLLDEALDFVRKRTLRRAG